MARDTKGGKKAPTGKSTSSSKKSRTASSRKQRDDEKETKIPPEKLAAESIKARQMQSAKELEGSASMNLDRDRAVSKFQLQRFEEFTREAVNKGVKGILEEYNTHLKPFIPPGISRKAFDANPTKNRYADVICIDKSRVVLENHTTDYIHANFVRGEPLINSFICTQGPMADSVKDFWKMISQESIGNIIMLCDTIEQGKEKCQQYWPPQQGGTLEWPGIFVKNVKIDNTDSTTVVTTLELTYEKKEKLTVKHHHWKTWPDKSVPQSVLAPFRLLLKARHSPRPTVVHCSAGIGRTGTVVALEVCYQQLLSENKLSILESVKSLRGQRMHAVQTELQYLYLFKCLLVYSSKAKTVPEECQKAFDAFEKEYQALIDAKMAEEKPDQDYAPLMPMKKQQT